MRGSLTSFTRRRAGDFQEPGRLTATSRHTVPLGFDAVGEALASGRCPVAACNVVGRALASDGASLGEALAGLQETYALHGGSAPDFRATEALSLAWSEATLEFLQDVSCEDPLTGLASQQHLRSRLAEVYREADRAEGDVRRSHALVVVDNAAASRQARRDVGKVVGVSPVDLHFSRALQLATIGEGVRTAFDGEETIARLGADTVAALVRRTPDLGSRVARMRTVLADLGLGDGTRIWIEGLPGRVEHASTLLNDLVAH